MTEADWQKEKDPFELLNSIRGEIGASWEFNLRIRLRLGDQTGNYPMRGRFTDRKARLYSAACCRSVWHLLTEPDSKKAVETAEHLADRLVSRYAVAPWRSALNSGRRRLLRARANQPQAWAGAWDTVLGSLRARAWEAAVHSLFGAHVTLETISNRMQADATLNGLLRDIFGNPFRPVTFEPRWRTSTVIDLAQSIYDDRAFDRMPILADALMDAGCDSDDILMHCRGPGPHVKGCWVVDLILGKE